MNELAQLVDTHLSAYCHPDAQERLAAIRRVWNAEGRLIDPPLAAAGYQEISEQAARLLAHYPGHRFERTTAVDAHNQFARYGWRLLDAQGQAALEGVDFVTLDPERRLLQIVGFFGTQPPASS